MGEAEGGVKSKKAGGSTSKSGSGSNSTMLVVGFIVALLAAAYAMFGDQLSK